MHRVIRIITVPTALIALSAASAQTQKHPETKVVLLGTGNPGPSPDKSGPATAIVVNGEAYLIDFGPGVVRRAAAAQRKGISALDPVKIRHAFVTHLHSDHTVGYPDLIFTPWVVGRAGPLEVFGPPGIKKMTDHVLAAWADDIAIRTGPIEADFVKPDAYRVNVHEISPGVIYRDGNVTVTAFNVDHGDWGARAFGYRFQTPDRVVVISGDTRPTSAVIDQCNGCDVLIHEVYTMAGYNRAPAAWQRMRRHYHTSSRELCDIAAKAHPKLLILDHQSYQFNLSNEDDLLREIQDCYGGAVVSGHDLEVF